jgi:C4-dicarboxylate-specific signal transduction histidine kinase
MRIVRELLASLDPPDRAQLAGPADSAGVDPNLLDAERLAMLGTLAGAVGHELTNITTVFLGTLYFIRQRAAEELPPEPHQLDDLDRVGDHLRSHGAHLLNLGRPGPDHAARLDAREIIKGTLAMLHSMGKTKYVGVEADLPDRPVWVTVNRTRLEQILVNLVANAADALAEVRRPNKLVRVSLWRDLPGSRVFCRVEDNGPGIAPEKLEKIFEPYFTTKPPGQGTGLGLPVVKQIVESYSGMLSVASRVGEGTAFMFDIPAADEKSRADRPSTEDGEGATDEDFDALRAVLATET